MLVAGFPAGPWGTNCFVVATGPGSDCIVIDPGKDAAPGIADVVREQRLRPVAVLLTHGHIDHMWSVAPVCKDFVMPAYVHPADRPLLADPLSGISNSTREALASMAGMVGGDPTWVEPDDVVELLDREVLSIAGLDLIVRHAPGHTRGSVMFNRAAHDDDPPILFSGDVLFAGSIGRTDLPGGDPVVMTRSLANVVLPLDDETVVLPGHGEATTIGAERQANPYLQDLVPGSGPDSTDPHEFPSTPPNRGL